MDQLARMDTMSAVWTNYYVLESADLYFGIRCYIMLKVRLPKFIFKNIEFLPFLLHAFTFFIRTINAAEKIL